MISKLRFELEKLGPGEEHRLKMSSPWFRSALVAVIGLIAAVVGFFLFGAPISQRIATQSAQNAFGHRKLNVLLLGYQDDEETTDTVILAHLDVDRQMATLVSIPRDTWVPIPGKEPRKSTPRMLSAVQKRPRAS